MILFKIQICDPELKFNKVAWTKKPLLRISTPKGYTDLGIIGGSDYVNGADPWSDFWGGVVGGGWVYYQSKGVEGHSSSAF